MGSDDFAAREREQAALQELGERKLVEAQLARQRDDLQLILDAIPAFVFYKDTKNRILRVNRAVAASLGVKPDDMANTDTARWFPEEAESYYADDQVVMTSRHPKLGIVERLDVAGDKRWVQTDKFPQLDSEGEVVGIVVIAQDITERRQLEQQLLQAQKLDSIGRLAGGVAHDFNNLLTTIFGHLELARRKLPPDSDAVDDLDTVRLAAVRGADLTKQLLAFARQQVIKPRQADLNGILRDADRLLRRVIDENIELRTVPAEGPLPVLIDPGQISQVILNMALNARDAMPDGGVLTLATGRVHFDGVPSVPGLHRAPGLYAVLTITDTGQGLTDEAKQHLFEPFFTTKPFGSGTGLGLATCYGMIKQNNGYITVQSEVGQGATFDIYLPLALDRGPSLPSDSSTFRAVQGSPKPSAAPVGQRGVVLLAEDDTPLRQFIERILVEAGFVVLAASNGQEASDRAARHVGSIDLLVADVVMPRLGGPALAARLLPARPAMKVLYMSGYSEDAVAREGSPGDASVVLTKPFTAAQLLAMLDRLLAAPVEGPGPPSKR